MKKTLLSLFLAGCVLFSTQLFAAKIDLNDVVGAVAAASDKNGKKSGNPLSSLEDQLLARVDKITGKLDKEIDKVTGKIDERINKYEKKIDDYEKKIDEAQRAADKVLDAVNGFNAAKLQSYITMAKYAAIGFVSIFVLSFLLLIVIFVQLLRVNGALKKLR